MKWFKKSKYPELKEKIQTAHSKGFNTISIPLDMIDLRTLAGFSHPMYSVIFHKRPDRVQLIWRKDFMDQEIGGSGIQSADDCFDDQESDETA